MAASCSLKRNEHRQRYNYTDRDNSKLAEVEIKLAIENEIV